MADASARFMVDDMWGAECSGYHLQFRPEADVIERIVSLQDHIESHFEHLLRVPPEALHMTVLILLPANRGESRSRPHLDARWPALHRGRFQIVRIARRHSGRMVDGAGL